MDLRGYETKMGKEIWSYEFYSEGPKGRIKKIIQFIPYKIADQTRFNLFLGDWIEENKLYDDSIITNNGDSLKVLITVALTVLEFTIFFRKHLYISREILLQEQDCTEWGSQITGIK